MSEIDTEKRKWHLGKVIDAPILVMLLIQTIGVIWYGAQLVKTVELQGIQIVELNSKVNRLIESQSSAAAPAAVIAAKVAILEGEVLRISARLDNERRR